MKRLTVITRIAICLAFLAVSALILADALGFVPNSQAIVSQQHNVLCESIAIHCSVLASRGEFQQMEAALRAIANRNSEILSMGIRRSNGKMLVDIGQHASHWDTTAGSQSSEIVIFVPIFAGEQQWGKVEIRFADLASRGLFGRIGMPLFDLMLLVGFISFLLFYLFLRRVLEHLDPSTKVLPDRVRVALNSLAEGLMLLDNDERIVLANEAFAATVGTSPEALQGCHADDLPWARDNHEETTAPFPWQRTITENRPQKGETLVLHTPTETESNSHKTFLVNASPMLDDYGSRCGVLTSFDDVIDLVSKRDQLVQMLQALKKSQEEVRCQNQKLQILATMDALTGCLNRRAFFEYIQKHWIAAGRYGYPISCIMLDVDNFKLVNDSYGHARGDEVLQRIGAQLRNVARDSDMVARYGGEEFCILLSHTNIDEAVECAERFRQSIANLDFEKFTVTISMGVSALSLGAKDSQQLLDEADQSLYAAKRSGRNRVLRWDLVRKAENNLAVPFQSNFNWPATPPTQVHTEFIPIHAVNALFSALSYRDIETASHSLRVADLCAATARDKRTFSAGYLLEIAALLHDIGKIGVPDSILLKSGPLTREEWKVMGAHERIGVEIVDSSFASQQLTETIRWHSTPFGGDPHDSAAPRGEDIPLSARILAIADAYDSMVTESHYRKSRSPEEAITELRRCAESQFDPALVEHFVIMLQHRGNQSTTSHQHVSNQIVLTIGLQIERIAQAIDTQDLTSLNSLANRLESTVAKSNLPTIRQVAAELITLTEEDDAEYASLIETTHELLDLCRSTQHDYLGVTGRAVVSS